MASETPEERKARRARQSEEREAKAKALAEQEAAKAARTPEQVAADEAASAEEKRVKHAEAVRSSSKRLAAGERLRPPTAARVRAATERAEAGRQFLLNRSERASGLSDASDQVGVPFATPEARGSYRRTIIKRKYGRQYSPVEDMGDDYRVSTIKTPNVDTPVNTEFTGSGAEGTVSGQAQRRRYFGFPKLPERVLPPEVEASLSKLPLSDQFRARKELERTDLQYQTDRDIAHSMSLLPNEIPYQGRKGKPPRSLKLRPVAPEFRVDDSGKGRWVRVSEHPATRGTVVSEGFMRPKIAKGDENPGTAFYNRLGFRPVPGTAVTPEPVEKTDPTTGKELSIEVPDTPFAAARRLEIAKEGPTVSSILDAKSDPVLFDKDGYPLAGTGPSESERAQKAQITKGQAEAKRAMAKEDNEVIHTIKESGTSEKPKDVSDIHDIYGSKSLDPSSDDPASRYGEDTPVSPYSGADVLPEQVAQPVSESEEYKKKQSGKKVKRLQRQAQAQADALKDKPGQPVTTIKIPERESDVRRAAEKAAARRKERDVREQAIERSLSPEEKRSRVYTSIRSAVGEGATPLINLMEQTLTAPARERAAATLKEDWARVRRFPDAPSPAHHQENMTRLSQEQMVSPNGGIRSGKVSRMQTPVRQVTEDSVEDTVGNWHPPMSVPTRVPTDQERELAVAVKDAKRRIDNPVDARALAYDLPMGTPVEELRGPKPPPKPPVISMGLSDDPVLRARAQREAGIRAVPESLRTMTTGVETVPPPAPRPPSPAPAPATSAPRVTMGPRQTELVRAQRASSAVDRQQRTETAERVASLAKEILHTTPSGMSDSSTGAPTVLGKEDLFAPGRAGTGWHTYNTGRLTEEGQPEEMSALKGPVGMVARRALFDAHVAAAKQLGTYRRTVVDRGGERTRKVNKFGQVVSETYKNTL